MLKSGITAVTTRRSKKFNTPIGSFNFAHTPPLYFYAEVSRIEDHEAIFFIAEPFFLHEIMEEFAIYDLSVYSSYA